MRGSVIAAFAAIVASSGCVQPQPQAPIEAPTREVPPAVVEAPPPPVTAAEPDDAPTRAVPAPVAPPPVVVPPPTQPAASNPVATAPAARPTNDSPAPRQGDTGAPQADQPAVRRNAEAPASPGGSAAPATPPVAALPPAATPTAPELDLAGLERRLRETPAIGLFTKLSLKNQVDDLLGQFRGFYQGQIPIQLSELRQRYELLLLKVLTLLQDTDRELAEAITASREAIWVILTDPQKLANI